MEEPLVSVLMPTYRRPQLLRKALASAVKQTYRNLQIIVRDNASGDETPDVVRSFTDSRILFLQAPENEGPNRNGAECMRHAKGKYFFPLCDDDFISENYISVLAGYMENDSEIMAGYGATNVINERDEIIRQLVPKGTVKYDAVETIRAWCNESLPLLSGVHFLCRMSFFLALGYRHVFPDGHNSDNAIFVAAGIRGKVLFTDKCIFSYRLHSLNSEQRHPSSLRARGDREFLEFLDDEVNSECNVGLPPAEWPRLRSEMKTAMARFYFGHFLRFRLHEDSVLELVRDTAVIPFFTYGIRRAWRQFREHNASLRWELKKRARRIKTSWFETSGANM